jgi:hypothetical protein
MTSRNFAPLLFRNMETQKKRTLLAVLAAVSWTAGAGEALVGFVGGGSHWYIMAAALFFTGAAFLEARRHTRVPGGSDRVSSPE